MSYEPLITALKERRKAAGLTQKNIAEMIGVTLKTYQRIERGETDMKMSHYRILVEKLKTTDLDISLDMLGIDKTTPWDVAAAARTLPPEVRTALVSMLMILYRSNTKE
ncbi:helix-turn-helix transcriptional regulator [Vibrio alginolyticus]|uniref:helix-turn-helix transcriptional regulator n=1 Tax=Vibrio alginolyticus TaxID=663 RepID=UPI001A8BFEBA|nr:helix-turn-helix transcriptional regulator [Vibrio alginolyticus]MBO0165044.1 helix-turn-helix transcriptional regulator [Vibrio alginolyticus]